MSTDDLATFNARQIHEMTGIAVKAIYAGWKNGSIPFIPKGEGQKFQHRVMTFAQIQQMLRDRTVQPAQPTAPRAPEPQNDLEAARIASRKAARRALPRVA